MGELEAKSRSKIADAYCSTERRAYEEAGAWVRSAEVACLSFRRTSKRSDEQRAA